MGQGEEVQGRDPNDHDHEYYNQYNDDHPDDDYYSVDYRPGNDYYLDDYRPGHHDDHHNDYRARVDHDIHFDDVPDHYYS